MDLEAIRREYLLGGLRRKTLKQDPFSQFELWMQQAIASQLPDPTAMVLATVDGNNQPAQRIVLLKHFDAQGFVFYTNYHSAKARQIALNKQVSLMFPWHSMERQVRLCGEVSKVSKAESTNYFRSRPKHSQLAAWASAQSQPIGSRQVLQDEFERIKNKFAEAEVPVPDFWGGYRIVPNLFEFWQGGANRLHDRFEYKKEGIQWQINRLAP